LKIKDMQVLDTSDLLALIDTSSRTANSNVEYCCKMNAAEMVAIQ